MQFRMLLFFAFLVLSNWATAQRNCGSMDYLEQQIRQDPTRQLELQQLERFTEKFDIGLEKELSGGILTVPVIVHVVYKNAGENISSAQIQSQIDVLNADFRRYNADRNNTPSDFTGVAADTEIEFCLTSVNRVASSRSGSFGTNDAVKSSATGGANAVNPTGAMNMWVCEIGGGILGYAQFPGGNPATDGVVIDYRYFGTVGTATAPFDLGRTATHEVGHWLNLRHIWGDGGCSVDDFVSDTPSAGGPNYTGGACTYPGPNSCRPRGKNSGEVDYPDMFQNYMDYSDDQCMNLFTTGQKDRMWAAVSASRPGLISATCSGTEPPTNPQEICDNGIDDDNDGLVDCADPDCSAFADCTPPAGDCPAPTGLTSTTSNRGRTLNMAWNASAGAQSYFVEVYENGSLYASGTLSGTGASVSISKRSSYTWRVQANCAGGASDFASTTVRAAARTTGPDVSSVGVFPNPSNLGEVTVTWNLAAATTLFAQPVITEQSDATVNVEVRDLTGRVLRQRRVGDSGKYLLDVSDLQAGVYLVQVRSQDGYAVSTKFVKL